MSDDTLAFSEGTVCQRNTAHLGLASSQLPTHAHHQLEDAVCGSAFAKHVRNETEDSLNAHQCSRHVVQARRVLIHVQILKNQSRYLRIFSQHIIFSIKSCNLFGNYKKKTNKNEFSISYVLLLSFLLKLNFKVMNFFSHFATSHISQN